MATYHRVLKALGRLQRKLTTRGRLRDRRDMEDRDLLAALILAGAGFDYLDIGEEATKESGCHAARTRSGIYLSGGR